MPQAIQIARTRDVAGFGWWFVALNATGIALLLARSLELREPAFIATNMLTLGFWAGVLVAKGLATIQGDGSIAHQRLLRTRS